MKSRLRLLTTAFPYLFYGLMIIFLVLYLRTLDWNKLADIELSWWYMFIASIIAIAYRYLGAGIWAVMLKNLGAHNLWSQRRELLQVYSKSWLGRYIPGSVTWIAGKIYFASKLGISKNKLAVSSLLEGGLQIIITLLIATVVLLFDSRTSNIISEEFRWLLILVLIVGLVVVQPSVFNRIFAYVYRLLKKKQFPVDHQATQKTILQGSLLYMFASIVGGFSFIFIAKAVYAPLSIDDIWFVLGASNLASAVSMLVIFVPSGIGIREGIQIALLSIIMPTEFALAIALITRLWSVIMDFAFFAFTYIPQRSR